MRGPLVLTVAMTFTVSCGADAEDIEDDNNQIESDDREDEPDTDNGEPLKKTTVKNSAHDQFKGMRMMQYPTAAIKTMIAKIETSDPKQGAMALMSLPSVPGHFIDNPKQATDLVIPTLVKVMNDTSKQTMRGFAVSKLLTMGKFVAPAIPDLVAGLKDKGIRQFITAGLGRLGDKAKPAVPVLIELLKSEDVGERSDAARGLGSMGLIAQDAIPALVQALEDSNGMVQNLSAVALGKMKSNSEAKAALEDKAANGAGMVKGAAIRALK